MKAIASNGVEINTGDPVLIRDINNENWRYAHFSHKIDDTKFSYVSSYGTTMYCIPYKGNEHLVGTNKDYKSYKDKFEFRFGAKVKGVHDNSEIEGILIGYVSDFNGIFYCIAVNEKVNKYMIGTWKWVESIEYI